MCIWDGSPMIPEDEREQAWQDPDDASYDWNDGQGETNGEAWKDGEDWPEGMAGPEYHFYQGMKRAEEEDEKRRKAEERKRRGKNPPPPKNNDGDGDGA